MEINLKGHYAGFVSRFLAYATDLLIVVLIIAIITFVFQTTQRLFHMDFAVPDALRIIFVSFGALVVMAVYFIFFWSLAGQTPGKMLLGVRAVSVDGSPLTLWQAVRRLVGYFISLILFLGYLWILVDDRRQGWHDKMAGTFVVYVWDARPGELFRNRIGEEPEA